MKVKKQKLGKKSGQVIPIKQKRGKKQLANIANSKFIHNCSKNTETFNVKTTQTYGLIMVNNNVGYLLVWS